MPKLRVLLADDHKIVRDGLKLLVNAQADMEVVGEAGNGREALVKAGELLPDVLVMDLSMPELNGLQCTEHLHHHHPRIKVLVLTVHEDESYLSQLCQAKASGYVLKRSAGDDLIHAIRQVAGGGLCFDPILSARALSTHVREAGSRGDRLSCELSGREKEVLTMVAWGYSNKEIASHLTLSVKTVETYKVRVGVKLRLRSRTELVQYALRQGWLSEGHLKRPLLNH